MTLRPHLNIPKSIKKRPVLELGNTRNIRESNINSTPEGKMMMKTDLGICSISPIGRSFDLDHWHEAAIIQSGKSGMVF